MKATFVGYRYKKWEADGKQGEYTDIYLVLPFGMAERDGAVGDKAVEEHFTQDLRSLVQDFVPGSPVDAEYGSGRKGKAELLSLSVWQEPKK
jgi:hypothetical protein